MAWDDRREFWQQQEDDARTPFEIDYSRVIHSASFRRLQSKTQILNLGESDFYRTRLTHSLEVAQIASGILQYLRAHFTSHNCVEHLPDKPLLDAICLTHDLGHPPFGHGGEVALNYCMRDTGGFEGNGQTLRTLSRLEKFSDRAGSNFTRRALLGILKYPVAYSDVRRALPPGLAPTNTYIHAIDRKRSKPPKCYHDTERDVVQWILEPLTGADRDRFGEHSAPSENEHGKARFKSLDCAIMDIADDVAYGVHDLEDVIAVGLVSEKAFRQAVAPESCAEFLKTICARYPGEQQGDIYDQFVDRLFSDGGARKRQISRLVHYFITGVEPTENAEFAEPLIRYGASLRPAC